MENRKRKNEYMVIEPNQIFNNLNNAIIELNKKGSKFRIVKLMRNTTKKCSKCNRPKGTNSFVFCPICGTKYS